MFEKSADDSTDEDESIAIAPLYDRLSKDPSDVDIDDMECLCEAIRKHKHYDFNPIVIGVVEASDTLQQLYDKRLPFRANGRQTLLVLTGGGHHWIVVEVFRDQLLNTFKVLILGDRYSTFVYFIKHKPRMLPPIIYYEEDELLQSDNINCAFFALYWARRLHKIENYIPNRTFLFNYLDQHISEVRTTPENIPVNVCRLPLGLTLCGQSRDFWTTAFSEYPAEEQAYPINKRGEIAQIVFTKHIRSSANKCGELIDQNYFIAHFRDKTINRYVVPIQTEITASRSAHGLDWSWDSEDPLLEAINSAPYHSLTTTAAPLPATLTTPQAPWPPVEPQAAAYGDCTDPFGDFDFFSPDPTPNKRRRPG